MSEQDEAIDRGDLLEDEVEELEEEQAADLQDTDDPSEEEDEEVVDDGESEEQEEDASEEVDEDSGDDEESAEIQIPKSRFDEVIAQRDDNRRLAEQQTEQVNKLLDMFNEREVQANKEPEKAKFVYDFDTKEDEYMQAVLDGETATAKTIRSDIRKAEAVIRKEETAAIKADAREEAIAEARKIDDDSKFDRQIVKFETEYTFLNQDGDNYSEKAVGKINGLMNRFIKAGSTRTEALTEAVELVAPLFGQKEQAEKKGLGGAKRRKGQLKKNANASNSQPAKMKGKTETDKNIDEYDINKMSEKEFNKLPVAIKRKLRGDV